MHTGISLLSIFFLPRAFCKRLCFHLFKQLVLQDEAAITFIFHWYSTKKLNCCGLNVQIQSLCPLFFIKLLSFDQMIALQKL